MAKKVARTPVQDVLLSLKGDIKRLKKEAAAVRSPYLLSSASWNDQEGIVISANDAQLLIDYIDNLKIASGRYD